MRPGSKTLPSQSGVSAAATDDVNENVGDRIRGEVMVWAGTQGCGGSMRAQLSLLSLLVAAGIAACSAGTEMTTGYVSVTTSTSGDSIDADGYTLTVDDGDTYSMDVDDTLTLELEEGTYSFELTDVSDNCEVDEDNPVSVDITAADESTATFTVTCAATS